MGGHQWHDDTVTLAETLARALETAQLSQQMLWQQRGHFIFQLDESPSALTAPSPFKCDLHTSLILWFKYFPRVRDEYVSLSLLGRGGGGGSCFIIE